jgi:hypothetical protein
MIRKRKALMGLGAVAAAFAVSRLGQFVGLLVVIFISHVFYPTAISWDGHDAWVKCPCAVADPTLWPPSPGESCEAMYLCFNEGALSESKMQILRGVIRKTPGCQKPD